MPQERSTDVAFDPRAYWEERLSESCDLRGVGYARKGQALNRWMYRHREWHLGRTIRRLGIDPEGKRVLDVGSGTGFYVDFWRRRGADVVASDLTEASVRYLRSAFPDIRTVQMDIASTDVSNGLGTYDIVGIFGVMFHIIGLDAFHRALTNLHSLIAPGGRLFLTDNFADDSVVERDHFASRSRETYEKALSELGFETPTFHPVFATLNSPAGVRNRALRLVATGAWEAITLPSRIRWYGDLVGLGLGLVDRAVIPHINRGPSTSLMVAKKAE
jgi:SAM-dependent methyltransferase